MEFFIVFAADDEENLISKEGAKYVETSTTEAHAQVNRCRDKFGYKYTKIMELSKLIGCLTNES